jgi:hypothetical protein
MSVLGPKTEVPGLARVVRFTLGSRHRQPAPACPFGANLFSARKAKSNWFPLQSDNTYELIGRRELTEVTGHGG